MDELRVAFLNCRNLTGADRAADVAATLRAACGNAAPHGVGLAEVADAQVARDVAEAAWHGAPYHVECRAGYSRYSGAQHLAILWQADALDTAPGSGTEVWSAVRSGRPHWMAVALQPRVAAGLPFWFVVNHWKSNIPSAWKTEAARAEASRSLGEFACGDAGRLSDAMLLIGDFNCEPHAPPFRHSPLVPADAIRLRAVREHSLLLNHRRRPSFFYNPMWRYLGESLPCAAGSDAPTRRLLGTYCSDTKADDEWLMWDQLMVTRPLLAGPVAYLVEDRVTSARPVSGCSDHCGIGLALRFTPAPRGPA